MGKLKCLGPILVAALASCQTDFERVEISESTASITSGDGVVQVETFPVFSENKEKIISNGMELQELSRIGSPLIDNETVQATDVLIKDGLVYATYNTKGEIFSGALQIFDIKDPNNPVLLDEARFSQAEASRVRLHGDYIYVAGGDLSLAGIIEVFSLRDNRLVHHSTLQTPGFQTTMLQIEGDVGIATTGDNGGVIVLDLVDPAKPTIKSYLPVADARYVGLIDNKEIVVLSGGEDATLSRYRLPEDDGVWAAPSVQTRVEGVTVGAPSWGNVIGNDLYISADVGGVVVYSLANGGIERTAQLPTNGDANGLAATPDQSIAILANGQEGLVAVDARNAASAQSLATYDVPDDCGSANAIAVEHDIIAMADGLGGVKLFRYNLNKVPGRLTTILLTLSNPGIPTALAGKLAKQAVQWTSPKAASKVLVVRDDFHNGEFEADTQFVVELLKDQGFSVDYLEEPSIGLSPDQVAGYDSIWFSNPGWPLDDRLSFDTLVEFSENGGGVVLQGDDMSWTSTKNFSLSPLTYVDHVDNGTDFCGVRINNGSEQRYQVDVVNSDHPVVDSLGGQTFFYNDDIDHSTPLNQGEEVLAWATLEDKSIECEKKSPVIISFGSERAAQLQQIDDE